MFMKDTEQEELSWAEGIRVLEPAREDKSLPRHHGGHASGEVPLRTSGRDVIGLSTLSAAHK